MSQQGFPQKRQAWKTCAWTSEAENIAGEVKASVNID